MEILLEVDIKEEVIYMTGRDNGVKLFHKVKTSTHLRDYFFENGLDFLKCYKAFEKDEKSELGQHWITAESNANLALYAFNLQDSSLLQLEVVNEKYYY